MHSTAAVDGGSPSDSDDAIPTRLFYPGYTLSDLERAFANRDLVNGFPWGVADVHTLGGIAQQQNISIAGDGSTVLTLRRPSVDELTKWDSDAGIQGLIQAGEKNGLVMKLSAAAMTGRVPTDVRSVEISFTLPSRAFSRNPATGMSGIGWAFWLLVDNDRLVRSLTKLGIPEGESNSISARVNTGALEEDIAELSLGNPTAELGYPLWVRLLSDQVLTFMAGRKTMTAKSARIDIMQTLFEPAGVGALPVLNDRTISGWLASGSSAQNQVLSNPLRARIDIGTLIYDETRDAMVAPMSFSLNGKRLTPTRTSDFPGLADDPNGNTAPNLSIWQVKTSKGQWITVPRLFILNLSSSRGHQVTGDSDSVTFSNLIITRGP